jgi:hypothetical protein
MKTVRIGNTLLHGYQIPQWRWKPLAGKCQHSTTAYTSHGYSIRWGYWYIGYTRRDLLLELAVAVTLISSQLHELKLTMERKPK